jgi:hypothetical protein
MAAIAGRLMIQKLVGAAAAKFKLKIAYRRYLDSTPATQDGASGTDAAEAGLRNVSPAEIAQSMSNPDILRSRSQQMRRVLSTVKLTGMSRLASQRQMLKVAVQLSQYKPTLRKGEPTPVCVIGT